MLTFIPPYIVDNGQVQLTVDLRTGTYNVAWKGGASLSGIDGEMKLADGQLRKTTDYSLHTVHKERCSDKLGSGVQITLENTSPGQPEMRQIFSIYDRRPEIVVQLEVVSRETVQSNYLAPVSTQTAPNLPQAKELQCLFVPYDNDAYVRYRSDGWGEPSHEVGAEYDEESHRGLVIGSLDHERWKSAVQIKRDSVLAFSGATDKYTFDKEPHGMLAGKTVSSPRFVMGWYSDWRDGMDRFGDLNAKVTPLLPWKREVPFGWNSWSGHKTKLNAEDARAATEFIKNDLPDFRNHGTAFINLDSFWDNMTIKQREEFVKKAHAAGLKAGIYYTPFTGWGNLTDRVQGLNYTYNDLVLKDHNGNPLPKIDGGYPLDPSHPGTLARLDIQLAEFVRLGFDYVKLDFMTHGSLEGKHADPNVTTGTEAYAMGMRRIDHDLSPEVAGHPIFLALSIAPMFPQGFAHSRRVSCDVFANIGATEYLLNSANYEWWTNHRIYPFNDPDSTCVYRPLDEPAVSKDEALSRMTATAIAGGLLIEGDDLTNADSKARVKELFTNKDVLALCRKALAFRPVFSNTGSKGGDAFFWKEAGGRSAYVALFNFGVSTSRTVELSRLGLSETDHWKVHNLWTGTDSEAKQSLTANLASKGCVLLHLTRD